MTPLEKFVQDVAKMDLVYAPNDPQNMTRVINAARAALQEEGRRRTAERDARTITLRFDDKTFRNIKRTIGVRGLCTQAGGLLDAFIMRLVEKVDAGETDWQVIQKSEVD